MERVPADVIRFAETVCGPEMALLGYAPRDASPGAADPLESFGDRLESVHEKFSGEYSGDPARLERERERLRLLETGLPDATAKRRWFITVEAYEALAKAKIPA